MKVVKFESKAFGTLVGIVTKENKRYTYVAVQGIPVPVQVPNSQITVLAEEVA